LPAAKDGTPPLWRSVLSSLKAGYLAHCFAQLEREPLHLSLHQKLGVNSRRQAVAASITLGIISTYT
jgi:hypothetical protein